METTKKQRSTKLIARFENGFAENWFFAVGDFFKNQLDIFLTDRLVDEVGIDGRTHRVKKSIWTQGDLFTFERGHIFYDSPKGYMNWKDALKNINIVCQIERATPDLPGQNKKRIDGFVVFDLWRPSQLKAGLEYLNKHRATQHAFVNYLKTGRLE